MDLLKNIVVPTGNICIMQGAKGKLEFLSLADYGKAKNIKADFLGFTDEINGVPHGELMPLTEKWVITVSTQYGCSMGCTFCSVPMVGPGVNVSYIDIIRQVIGALELHPEIGEPGRINLHYARMGEPTWNNDVLVANHMIAQGMKKSSTKFHPVISTMMPKHNTKLENYLKTWIDYKNFNANGDAGLQLSINTTDEAAREKMFSGNALSLEEISEMMKRILSRDNYALPFKGRKIALNFALTGDEINGEKLRRLFDPQYFMCKITPLHMTQACEKNGMSALDGYTTYNSYRGVEAELKCYGFDVLVFVPSKEEDESRITCGNAILSETI
jgi:23S rRNA (adenine2503-C2)-methyltransferase